MEQNKLDEIASAAASKDDSKTNDKPFGPAWGHEYFGKWQTAIYALRRLGIPEGASVLDVGMGTGWTTVFLAESGFRPTGIDIAPASVEVGERRASRWGVAAEFQAADMDDFQLGRTFDAAFVFDALHHSQYQPKVVARIADHLEPGAWVLFGEPSWLHAISPGARRTSREYGWTERGIRVRELKRHCGLAGLGEFRRFYEGTVPHDGSVRGLGYQAARLLGGRFSTAPQMSVWLAARKGS